MRITLVFAALVAAAVIAAALLFPAASGAAIVTDLSYERGTTCTVLGGAGARMWDEILQERNYDPNHPADFVPQSAVRLEGSCAAKITVHDEDTRCQPGQSNGCLSAGERATAVKNPVTRAGDTDVFTVALRYASGWPTVSTGFCTNWSTKQQNNIGDRAGLNNIVIGCETDTHALTVRGGDINAELTNITANCTAGPFAVDTWYEFVIRVKWSRDNDGFVDAYRNGVKFCDASGIDTVFDNALSGETWDPDIRVQHGLYRNGTAAGTAVLFSDAVAVHDALCEAKAYLGWPESAEPTCAYRLVMSTASNRSGATELAGTTVARKIYVFAKPDSGVLRVRFFLDDPQMQRAPRTIEGIAPYDFAGGMGTAASPFDTKTIANGSHMITAAIDLSAGGTRVVNGTFTAAN